MAQNKLYPFATASGALTLSSDAWGGLPARLTGFQNGEADPAQCNTAWRLGLMGTSALGEIVSRYAGVDAVDDGDIPGFADDIRSGVSMMLSAASYGKDTSSTANVVTVTLDPVPASLTAFRTVYVKIANTNTGPANLVVNAFGSRNITRANGLPLQAADLLAGQIYQFLYNPDLGQFALAGLLSSEVAQTVNNPILYVRIDGSDANDGSANTASKAFSSVGAAVARAAVKFNSSNTTITIQIGTPGTYAVPGLLPATLGTLVIQGDVNNQGAYILQGAGPGSGGVACVNCTGNVNLIGITVNNTGAINHTIAHGGGGRLNCYNVTVGSTNPGAYSHYTAGPAGSIWIYGGCIITGSMTAALLASVGSITINAGTVITVQGTPTYTAAFAYASTLGAIFVGQGASITGNANGLRYFAAYNSVIGTSGGGTNLFPGNAAGSTSNGGWYF